MKTLQDIISTTNTQTRRNAIQYAMENNYKINDMYNQAKEAWFKLMCKIHANNKQGDYELAGKYKLISETLETWAG